MTHHARPARIRIARFGLLPLIVLLAACTSPPHQTTGKPVPLIALMGEVHDNPDGHQQRFTLLAKRVHQGARPAIVMEQFDREQAPQLAAAMASCRDAACVVQQAGNNRWDWPLYYPLIDLALQYKLPVIAGNMSRDELTRLRREGWQTVFSPEEISKWQLPASIPITLKTGQAQAIIDGHCQRRPPQAMLDGFINAQIARDIWMADMLIAHRDSGVVLIAGNGHVRADIGVPFWLAQRGYKDVETIGFVESASRQTSGQFSTVIAVKPHARPDPCQTFQLPAAKTPPTPN